jgi:hypothetical protein
VAGVWRGRRLAWAATVTAALLVAVAALASFSGSASGTETAPENTSPPTISPTSPVEGAAVTAANGTWTGSPTGYAYQWYRCSGTGTCVSIPGATSSTYFPLESQLGSTLRVSVTATNGAGSGSALSAATSAIVASTGPFQWYACKELGAGKGSFEDSACTKSGKGNYDWIKLVPGFVAGLQVSGSKPFAFGWNTSGVPIAVSCSSQSGSGQVENPGGISPAALVGTTFKLSGCTVTQPAGKGCKVSGESVSTQNLKAAATESAKPRTLKFQPTFGTQVLTFAMTGCSTEILNTNWIIAGSFEGIDGLTTSSLEFTKERTGGLTVGAFTAYMEGTLKIETTPGKEALKLAP